ncbi:FAD-binding domain-containing protein [Lactarius deliciosus]|nr:FAD-binding domain-containing protein [Lactarius deliciosus]
MLGTAFLGSAAFLAASALCQQFSVTGYEGTCKKIERAISSASQVFYPGSPGFEADISHWANSSSQVSACSVEPGTPQDIGLILRELAKTRTPFAVKSAGHAVNRGFSSTLGVQISLTRFDDIVIDEDSETVEIGAGLTWTDVYASIVPKGINVVGGRINGVGVPGLTLGGGYSWKTNQFGLTLDTVTKFELVLPSGEVTTVTEKDEDLWFGLRGGLNNYGVVTKFTLKSHKQPDIWAALINFVGDQVDGAQQAFSKFVSEPHDHKALQLGEFVYANGTLLFGISLFYDGPEPPQGLYDELLNLPSASKSIVEGSFVEFVDSQLLPGFKRGYLSSAPILHYTEPIMNAFMNETEFYGKKLSQYDPSVLVVYTIDPFESDLFTHGSPSAYPPDRTRPVFPSSIYYGWTDESVDKHMDDAIRTSTATLERAGIQDGQDLENAPAYVNYAISGTPLEKIYGGNLQRLREIRAKYDPEDIMGLAGGWKF